MRNSVNGGSDSPYTLTVYYQKRIYNLNIRLLPQGKCVLGKKKRNEVVSTYVQFNYAGQSEPGCWGGIAFLDFGMNRNKTCSIKYGLPPKFSNLPTALFYMLVIHILQTYVLCQIIFLLQVFESINEMVEYHQNKALRLMDRGGNAHGETFLSKYPTISNC